MKKLICFPLLGLLLWMSSCSSSQVAVDKDPEVDVSRYQTFSFTDMESPDNIVGNKNPLYTSSLIERNIHSQISRELIARGLSYDPTNPDVKVAYHTYTENKRSTVNDYYPMMYGGWYWRYYPYGIAPFPYTTQRSYTYTEGTLIIDLIDSRSNQLVWRGSVDGAVEEPNRLQRQVEKAVKLIFKEYPVTPDYSRVTDQDPMASQQ